MGNVNPRLEEIIKNLCRLPEHKLEAVNDFVDFLLSRYEGKSKEEIIDR